MVVLNDGDLTAAEAENEIKTAESAAPDLDKTKIMFKKPTKRSKEDDKKEGKDKDDGPSEASKRSKKAKKQAKNLLSFNDDEEET